MFDRYSTIIFDVDGTLIRLFEEHARSYVAAVHELTGKWMKDIGFVKSYFPTGSENTVFNAILVRAGVTPSEKMIIELRRLRAKHFAKETSSVSSKNILPGVSATLEKLKKSGKTLYCFSGSSRGVTMSTLRRTGLNRFFSHLFFLGDNPRMKDKESMLHEIVRQTKTNPQHCCVVGDTPADIRAARKNRMGFVAVTTGLHPRKELAREAGKRVLARMVWKRKANKNRISVKRLTRRK